jgi:hypothetical protein
MLEVTSGSSEVELIWPSRRGEDRLVSPGDAMVVRAARDSFISVEVIPSHRNGSRDAELALERVSTSLVQRPLLAAPKFLHDAKDGLVSLEVLAHVARRGDVVVGAGEWIGGPDFPMAIEGLEIRWAGRPQGVEVIASGTVDQRGARPLAGQPTGRFLGSRGRSSPLTSLTLSLEGVGAEDFLLTCDALFLGLPIMTVSGPSLVMRGATGHEPLVGLRLSVVPAAERPALRTIAFLRNASSLPAPAEPVPVRAARAEKPARTRIFRSARVKPSPAYS